MELAILTRREWRLSVFFTFALAVSLALGFLATARQTFSWISGVLGFTGPLSVSIGDTFAFPLMALFFYLSLPQKRRAPSLARSSELLTTFLAPLAIALVFGAFHRAPPLFDSLSNSAARWSFTWYVIAIPIGEELLFRGWLYRILDRVWPAKFPSPTNPLPVAVWLTAVAFSVWHLQNLMMDPPLVVGFQIFYTFFTGLWLGYLRWKGGRLWLPLAAHLLLNLFANLL